ncbi:MAG: LysM domain-containing protein [Nanoarchaeota archaeon]|nr:LysM domain-containing protein [Nanoarchaeota archaeon]
MKRTSQYIWGTALGLLGVVGILLHDRGAAKAVAPLQKTALVSNVQSKKPSLEVQVQTSLPNFLDFEDAHYHKYDATILCYTQWMNAALSKKNIPGFQPLDPAVVKAQLLQESGGLRERAAYDHDPMQIANKGDYGLKELQTSAVYARLGIPDCSVRFKDIAQTPFNKGRWDYAGTKLPAGKRVMDADTSILGGIIFLADKAASSDTITVKTGQPFVYMVKPKDTLWSIAKKEGSTLAVMQEINPGFDPKKMLPGMSIIVQRAHEEPHIAGIDWYKGLQNYNGNGTARYADAVMVIRGSEVRE